jgi:hypothetical protein
MTLPPIIPTPQSPPRGDARAGRRLALAVLVAAFAWGTAVAWYYYGLGLTLSHYDAKGHLVVARRIFDSITPGWMQIGAVWLPLPHLLNMVPVQVDAFYRTGASGVAISVVAFAVACWAIARIVLTATDSPAAAWLASALFALNPNVNYLQATPMTEPLLFAGLLVSVVALHSWIEQPSRRRATLAGAALAASCLVRYEAWPFTAAALGLTAVAYWRRTGLPFARAIRASLPLAILPVLAILGFFVLGKLTTNHWFVTDGFYVPDPALRHRPFTVTAAIWFGLRRVATGPLAWTTLAAVVVVFARGVTARARSQVLVTLALGAVVALPWYAFFQGHPFRVRYMVPMVAGCAIGAAIVIGWLPGRLRRATALVLLASTLVLLPPLSPRAAMVVEAQWDRPKSALRRQVTACLAAERTRGELILASMGSLAHYMQELSWIGLDIGDFIHEGNGEYWADALSAPALYVPWVLVEERSEGGDVIAQRARRDPEYLRGFVRRCEGGGVALYENVVMRKRPPAAGSADDAAARR